MPNQTNAILVAVESDPVATAVSAALGAETGLRRVEPGDFAPNELALGDQDVLLIGDSGLDVASNVDFNGAVPGLVQFLGCRSPTALIGHLKGAGTEVAGVSPVMAPRVANRVVGLAGPLLSSNRAARGGAEPNWGIIGLGVTGTEVARKLVATRAAVGMADIRTPRAGIVAELEIRRQSLDLLVAGSDAVTLHVYPGATASPLITERELGLMKSGGS